jgi:hypothetical protein
MSSAGSTRASVDQPEPARAPALKRNSDDVGWEYGVIDPNDTVTKPFNPFRRRLNGVYTV